MLSHLVPALVLVFALALAPTAGADPVAVEPTGDAEAEMLAVSGTGDASSGGFAASGTGEAASSCRTFGTIPCATVTALGSTRGSANDVDGANGRVCHNNGYSGSTCAVNMSGDANHVVAVASGDAHGWAAFSREGEARGYVVLSESGDTHSYYAGVTLYGRAGGGVGVSAFGDSDAYVGVAPFGSAEGAFVGVGGCDLRDELCLSP